LPCRNRVSISGTSAGLTTSANGGTNSPTALTRPATGPRNAAVAFRSVVGRLSCRVRSARRARSHRFTIIDSGHRLRSSTREHRLVAFDV
jgi:hypothetical protein